MQKAARSNYKANLSAAALFLMSDEGRPCLSWAEGSGCVSFGSFSFAQAKKMNTPVGAGTHIF